MSDNYIRNLNINDKLSEIIDFNTNQISLKASVVIVTYNTNHELFSQNLESLKKQFDYNFEIIIVENSDKRDVKSIALKYTLKYIKLKKNYGLSLARNIGIKYAKGDIVIFLDDDAIPANDFVEQHIKAHKNKDIIGLRGKAIPINKKSIYNYFSHHYDYGNKVIPCYINLEGNSSFKKEELKKIGGFNPNLEGAGGYEGLELTYRLVEKYKDKNKLIYYPEAIIYHDYSKNFISFIKKRIRHKKYFKMLKEKYKSIADLREQYSFNLKRKYNLEYNRYDFLKIKFIEHVLSIVHL